MNRKPLMQMSLQLHNILCIQTHYIKHKNFLIQIKKMATKTKIALRVKSGSIEKNIRTVYWRYA